MNGAASNRSVPRHGGARHNFSFRLPGMPEKSLGIRRLRSSTEAGEALARPLH